MQIFIPIYNNSKKSVFKNIYCFFLIIVVTISTFDGKFVQKTFPIAC